jgi:hypothetical protein
VMLLRSLLIGHSMAVLEACALIAQPSKQGNRLCDKT